MDILPHDPLEALCISMVSVAPGRTGCRLARLFVIVDRGFEGRAFYPHSRSRVSFEYVPRCGYPVAETSRRAVYFSGERGRVRLGHVGASPDRRASAGLRAPLFTPESATACDTVPTLTIEIHSVSSGRGSGHPHPGRRPRSIAMHRSPSEFTAFRVVVDRAVHTGIGALFRSRAVAHRRISQRFDSSRVGLSTPESAYSFGRVPALTIEIHRVFSVWRRRYPHADLRRVQLRDGMFR
ncbi:MULTISPECIES: hypothetical protein [unclassified Burkholderia]|uniref:hypothetical protein n=1 Tax=unclassified Burkholderia TaxID=2613784 RepID=UPI0012E34C64|nr:MULTISPECIES: hypothetical protein [unclassified Burkholderia]